MVVTQEHKTYYVGSMLHLPSGFREVEPTATSYHTNYVNINGVSENGRMQHNLKSYISKTACYLFITEERDAVNLSVS